MIRQSDTELGAMLRAALEPQLALNPIRFDRVVTGLAVSGVVSPSGAVLVVAYEEAKGSRIRGVPCCGGALMVTHAPGCPRAGH